MKKLIPALFVGLTSFAPASHATEVISPDEMEAAAASMNARALKLYDEPPKYTHSSTRYSAIEDGQVSKYLAELTAFSQQSKARGEPVWGRVQGSQAERDATHYVASKFKDWGLEEVRVDTFPLNSGAWEASEMALTALTPDGKALRQLESAATAYPSGQTPVGGLVAPLEYVGLGTAADLRGRDLSGKIALIYVRTFNGVLLHSGLAAANRISSTTDAAGMILWIDLPGNGKFAAQVFAPDRWINNIPWINVGFQDGFYLRQLIEQATDERPATVRLNVRGKIETDRSSQNLVGRVRGKTDENIIITGHIDGFWNAILDNGTGIASLMGLARYYANAEETPQRNLVFLVTGDHELEGAGGSAVFEQMYPEVMQNTVLVLQLEHLLGPNTSNMLNTLRVANSTSPLKLFISNGSTAVMDTFRQTIEEFGIVVDNHVTVGTLGDVDGIASVPSAGFIQTGQYYHSDQDELDLYQPDELAHITKTHAALIDAFNKMPRDAFGAQGDRAAPLYASDELETLLAPW